MLRRFETADRSVTANGSVTANCLGGREEDVREEGAGGDSFLRPDSLLPASFVVVSSDVSGTWTCPRISLPMSSMGY